MEKISIVVPAYNEEESIPYFYEEINKEFKELKQELELIFVDDGSKDKTWEIIENLAAENSHFIGMSQSRNRGHQNAVLAGLMESKDMCDITISIDCDGQDDIKAMEAMVDAYHDGSEVVMVCAARETRIRFLNVLRRNLFISY